METPLISVASYCRVSTDRADQVNSFEAQQRFFREWIEHHQEWKLYKIYADDGITGTSTIKRAQFNQMIHDAHAGKFKLIITKEISRFSRNILDTIWFTRELKSIGVGVIFMNDGINTMEPDSELRLSIMGSIAQEESRRTSSRVKWGQTRQMEQGVVFGHSLLGYDVREGKMTVNPEGAALVELIFQKYGIEKKGTSVIARELENAGYRTSSGNDKWSCSYLNRILKNEKYVGDLIQKKTITANYLTHEKKRNCGEEEMVIIPNHHEPIIDRELFQLVQEEMEHRNRCHNQGGSNCYVFSGKIKCGECGSFFVSRIRKRKDGTSYRRWACYTAVTRGREHKRTDGTIDGCNIGKIITDDLAREILKMTALSINVDIQEIFGFFSNIVMESAEAELADKTLSESKLKSELKKCIVKTEMILDAYFSNEISKEELDILKTRYHKQADELTQKLNALKIVHSGNLQSEIQKKIQEIISCETQQDVFLKHILEQMTVFPDGRVEVQLKKLPQIWIFTIN